MRAADILLVEDNPGDARLTREAFASTTLPHTLHNVRDGEEALAFLRRQGRFGAMPQPDLVLLDLNLPRRDGREVLEEIKRDPALLHIPIVVLSSSEDEEDIRRSYRLHANCFITKPADLQGLARAVAGIERYWFRVVQLPSAEVRV